MGVIYTALDSKQKYALVLDKLSIDALQVFDNWAATAHVCFHLIDEDTGEQESPTRPVFSADDIIASMDLHEIPVIYRERLEKLILWMKEKKVDMITIYSDFTYFKSRQDVVTDDVFVWEPSV